MKTINTLVATAVFTMILGFLVVVPVHAQVDFDSWEDKWFKGTAMDKGFIVDDTGTSKSSQKIPTYVYVQCWDGGQEIFTAWLVQKDAHSGAWMGAVPYVVQVINGTPLDFVVYGFIPPGTIPEIELFALIISFMGKEKDGVLKSAKVKSVGGCVIYNLGGGMHFSANESFKVKWVSANKVPDEVQEKIEMLPLCP